MEKYKVSIITATYNSEAYILETYRSILNQAYANFEWLITDDASSDGTVNLIKSLQANDSRIKLLVNDVNAGSAVSRNKSLSMANGDFLAFIDSDDRWNKGKIFEQVEFMSSNNINFSFTAYELIDEDGENMGISVDSKQKGAFTYVDMLKKKATLGCSTVMLNRHYYKDLKMPLLRTGQDYATWLSILKEGEKAYILPSILSQYRICRNSISRNKFKKAIRQWEIYRRFEFLGFFESMLYFFFYAFRAVFRKG